MIGATIARALGRRKIEAATLGAVAAMTSLGIVRYDDSPAAAVAAAVAPSANMHFLAAATAKVEAMPTTPSTSAMDLPVIDHPRVASWIKRFTTDQRGSYATYLKRMDKYEPMISGKLASRDMPQGLIYLAMIESGFNPTAKSRVAATGLWQFMSATGRQYGLKVTRKVDERKNPARATDAALEYLSDLHDRFGSWYLAAAAYNTGQGRVSRVLKQVTGKSKGTDADYYRIASRLPQETRDYVPKLIAAAQIGSNPARYGFSAN